MRHIPIKLGPLALLLTVISICMTTLGVLAFATARADWNLAQKYADTVQTRYALEAEGQRFLQTATKALEEGNAPESLDSTERDDDGTVWKTFQEGEFSLRVGIVDESGHLRVVGWRIQKEWEPEGARNLWMME